MRPVRMLLAVVLAVASLAVAGCAGGTVAATINGEDVYVEDIEAELDAIKEEFPQMFEGVDGEARELDFRRRILDNMVTNLLVTQAAEEQGIEVADEDVDAAVDELRKDFPDETSFEQSLADVNMTLEELRGQVREQLQTQAILDMVSEDLDITAADVEEYYESNESQFSEQAARRAAHILFAADDKETAERVLEDVRGGADFESVAEQYSIDPASAERGGDLGWPSTPYVTEFQEALDELAVGDVSDLVESVFGWHIITVLDEREERVRTLDEARDEIELILQQQRQADAFQQFIDGLYESAEIEYFIDYAPTS